MTGVGGSPVGNVVGKTIIDIGSIYNKKYSLVIQALVVKSIGTVNGFDRNETLKWTHLNGLTLADPNYFEPSEIDILLGTIAHADILLPELHKGKRGQPIAQSTELGWLVSGRLGVSKQLGSICNNVNAANHIDDTELCKQLKAFWEVEEVTRKRLFTKEEQIAEDTFANTVKRSDDGKFVVDLPLKLDLLSQLGDSWS